MKPETKYQLKKIALILSVLSFIALITFLIVKNFPKNEKEDDGNDRNYSSEEIKAMQSFLIENGNETIKTTIQNSGGIDGKRGQGFELALEEAKRIKLVRNLKDLYRKSKK